VVTKDLGNGVHILPTEKREAFFPN
jgi:hypothetical protein